jgi:hypothetical protein
MQSTKTFFSAAIAAAAVFLSSIHPAPAKPRDGNPVLKLVCVTSLSENQDVVLASRDGDGDWKELSKLQLRNSLISQWLPAEKGELHIALSEDGKLKSIGQFTLPEGARRSLVLLRADKETNTYVIRAVDPLKEAFAKGTMLVFNFSGMTGSVTLGSDEQKVEAESHRVLKPVPDENGTYRMLVSILSETGDSKLAYDRQVPANPDSREMVFLLPDKTLGMKVMSLPVFGEFE